ncbi:uncharacterized protein LOC116033235 [Ipomoea triloba]|uniref:uncharacterized protein LOC116033235 n=1 Tax=Ipomoea triloba TaxID=35885 RepID=UPI00125DD080|nr:uncharacterized protein LOC116033235 [Ipomoea triloba]
MDILSQDNNSKRGKNVAFIAEECDSEEECEELDDESVAMITRNFTKILKQINRRNRGGTSTWTNVETHQKILRKYNPTCHYCYKKGHTRPECYRFYSDQRTDKFQKKWITPVSRQVWGKWYFDSGCSRHMTDSKEFLKNVIPYTGQVTFGDGIKGDIMGIGILNVAGLPSLSKHHH